MTGVDTNILVRYLVEDDQAQTDRVHRFLAASRRRDEFLYVSCIVLCETVWSLRSMYGIPKPDVLDAVERVLETRSFQVEEERAVRRALELSRRGPGDFADYLIGELNRDHGCRVTVTFDRALRSAPAFSVL